MSQTRHLTRYSSSTIFCSLKSAALVLLYVQYMCLLHLVVCSNDCKKLAARIPREMIWPLLLLLLVAFHLAPTHSEATTEQQASAAAVSATAAAAAEATAIGEPGGGVMRGDVEGSYHWFYYYDDGVGGGRRRLRRQRRRVRNKLSKTGRGDGLDDDTEKDADYYSYDRTMQL